VALAGAALAHLAALSGVAGTSTGDDIRLWSTSLAISLGLLGLAVLVLSLRAHARSSVAELAAAVLLDAPLFAMALYARWSRPSAASCAEPSDCRALAFPNLWLSLELLALAGHAAAGVAFYRVLGPSLHR